MIPLATIVLCGVANIAFSACNSIKTQHAGSFNGTVESFDSLTGSQPMKAAEKDIPQIRKGLLQGF